MIPCRNLVDEIAGLREQKDKINAEARATAPLVDYAVAEWKSGPGGRRARSIITAFARHCRAWRTWRAIRIYPIERRYRKLAEEAERERRKIEEAAANAREKRLFEEAMEIERERRRKELTEDLQRRRNELDYRAELERHRRERANPPERKDQP